MKSGIRLTFLFVTLGSVFVRAEELPLISPTANGTIVHTAANNGDRVPDFSFCGFMASDASIPFVSAAVLVEPSGADDTVAIQTALDHIAQQVHVAQQVPNGKLWRGAVVLGPGEFRISQTLYLRGDHVVLRGSVDGSGTLSTIHVVGKSRRPAIVIGSDAYDKVAQENVEARKQSDLQPNSSIIVNYVATGASCINVENVSGFEVGQTVTIVHPSTQQWIEAVGMSSFPSDDGKGSWLDWKPNTLDQSWTRTIVDIDGDSISVDAPLTSSINPQLTQGRVVAANTPHHYYLGVEHLRLVSNAETSVNPLDEEHAWDGIRFSGVTDAWARNISFRQFAGSAVQIGQNSRKITVADCSSSKPISELAGWRRHTFFCLGQQALFLRCTAEEGRHDFSTGPLTTGPNAFVYCTAKNTTNFSGPLGSWATGVLFDNVEVDGGSILLNNHETNMAGTGWAAANSVLWNCVAPQVVCRCPPTAFNLAVGIWGEVVGDGTWRSLNEFVTPDSLFAAQLKDRVGQTLSQQVLADVEYSKSSSEFDPTALAKLSRNEIDKLPIELSASGRQLRVTNGWLTIGDRLAIGSRQTLTWWRGSTIAARAVEYGVGLTRYVPGLDGTYFTSSVDDLVAQMNSRGSIALEHHWGLWYDRRRDDHQMLRRMNGDVWPPFDEQPWARSGQGRAWDGLSKYDLTRFNHWYFDRLAQFAAAADQQGLILMQQMYFQHNLLEAGAHWADFPWRPVNCIQNAGFTEPPVYENRKRVIMAEEFYDIAHPLRRELHSQYIRHCLDTLGRFNNVVFVVGEEYSGPAHFMRFWLDTIRQWSAENSRDVLVMLSACRNVQEEILSDPEYHHLIDIVDVKYWWHTSDGEIYDPPGGQNLAPRQQLRTWTRSKARSAESICRSISDLKSRFPEKAVTCSLPSSSPWMMVAAGCSLTELPSGTDESLLREIINCRPETNASHWSLNYLAGDNENVKKLVVSLNSQERADIDLTRFGQVDSRTGKVHSATELNAQKPSEKNPWILWNRDTE